ncbi:putative rna polymerase i subunit protein [Neofusicoccum parvum UCRNP2]|uniref:Putative rna polymerase i subunit protein n=1 Tax=Botryosphaeria parva (strain UCR-NP2) TaxID=1287680 RepID=R1EBA1_BOTPV|nr:putative rna polymerase i subunit protein [Neofusicoccum parvum UCRNP2]
MKVVEKTKEAEPASSSAASDDSSEESSEDEESSEESEESEESAEAKKTEATKKTATNGSAGGSDSSRDDSESESEEESEEEAAASSTRAPDTSRLQTTQTRISKPFEPPSGFKPAKLGLHPSSNLAKLLQSTDLSKKQIWHITAPANIDIKQVKQFAQGKAALKEPAIEHKGVGYAFIPEEKDTRVSTKLLVPTEKGYAAGTLNPNNF